MLSGFVVTQKDVASPAQQTTNLIRIVVVVYL